MAQPMISLNDGHTIPQLGFGTWQVKQEEAAEVVGHALAAGYRHVDTAYAYDNEEGVGEAIRNSGIAREELFVTTKLPNPRHGHDETLRTCEASLKKLGLDYLDLYLIHWPVPSQDKYVESWKAFIRLRDEGRVRSLGVSNFDRDHLERIIGETGVTPTVNQIELHPRFQQRDQREHHRQMGIVIESWSPLGRGDIITDPALVPIAEKHGKSVSQIILRWHLDERLIVIPRSRTPDHIKENFDVFGFTLDDKDRAAIAAMDDPDGRMGPKPSLMGLQQGQSAAKRPQS